MAFCKLDTRNEAVIEHDVCNFWVRDTIIRIYVRLHTYVCFSYMHVAPASGDSFRIRPDGNLHNGISISPWSDSRSLARQRNFRQSKHDLGLTSLEWASKSFWRTSSEKVKVLSLLFLLRDDMKETFSCLRRKEEDVRKSFFIFFIVPCVWSDRPTAKSKEKEVKTQRWGMTRGALTEKLTWWEKKFRIISAHHVNVGGPSVSKGSFLWLANEKSWVEMTSLTSFRNFYDSCFFKCEFQRSMHFRRPTVEEYRRKKVSSKGNRFLFSFVLLLFSDLSTRGWEIVDRAS